MLRLPTLLAVSMLIFTQCTPCRYTSCGCDGGDDYASGLQVIEAMEAQFGGLYPLADSTVFLSYNVAAINFRISRFSPLANLHRKSSWSFFPTASACDPYTGGQQATTYFSNIIVIAEKADTIQQVSWAEGDTIVTHFNFGTTNKLKEPIPEFLAKHNLIRTGDIFQLKLAIHPGGKQKRLKMTIHLVMSGGKIFTFENVEMRVY